MNAEEKRVEKKLRRRRREVQLTVPVPIDEVLSGLVAERGMCKRVLLRRAILRGVPDWERELRVLREQGVRAVRVERGWRCESVRVAVGIETEVVLLAAALASWKGVLVRRLWLGAMEGALSDWEKAWRRRGGAGGVAVPVVEFPDWRKS